MVIKSKIFTPLLTLALWPAGQAWSETLDLPAALAKARLAAREVAAAEARQRAASARFQQARLVRWPKVTLSEIVNHTDAPADAFGLLLAQERFDFSSFAGSDPNNPDPLTTAITRLEIEMPIYTGGEIKTRRTQAENLLAAAGDDLEWVAEKAALAAALAYVDLVEAREQVELLGRSRETVAGHLELARAYAGEGLLVPSEVLRAEVELARMDDLLATAEGGERVAEAHLSFRLGAPLDARWQLAPLPEVAALAPQLAPYLDTAAGRSDLAAAKRRLAAGELEARAQRAGRLPSVGLAAHHDRVDDVPFGSHGEATTVVMVGRLELFDGGRRQAAILAAEEEAAAGREEMALFEQGIALEIEHSYQAARAALQRITTATKAVAAAEEALRIVEERFRAGVMKTLDVLDAATARREAESRELSARADAQRATFRLALAAGRAPESGLGGQP